jgi:hypothetical protein
MRARRPMKRPSSSSSSLRSFLHCGAPVSHGKIIVFFRI